MTSLFSHRSIRQYKSDPVPENILKEIISAGTRASNTGNMQLYSVVITCDKENKAKLAEYNFNQPSIVQSPIALTICADIHRFSRWCECRNANGGYNTLLWLISSVLDASLFSQNICLAAEEKGLGICYLGSTMYSMQEVIDLLKLPKGVIPITTITMGYPAESPELTERLPVEAVIHEETYKEYTSECIDELYSEIESMTSSKEFVEENHVKNLAQVYTDVRYTKKDSIEYSKKMLEILRKQGFDL